MLLASCLPPRPLERSSPPSGKQNGQTSTTSSQVPQTTCSWKWVGEPDTTTTRSVKTLLTKMMDLFIISGWVVDPNFSRQSCQEASVPFKNCLGGETMEWKMDEFAFKRFYRNHKNSRTTFTCGGIGNAVKTTSTACGEKSLIKIFKMFYETSMLKKLW